MSVDGIATDGQRSSRMASGDGARTESRADAATRPAPVQHFRPWSDSMVVPFDSWLPRGDVAADILDRLRRQRDA
jgi:hypothetical protein